MKDKRERGKVRRPRAVERLAALPGIGTSILTSYDEWLRWSYRRFWNWNNAGARRAFAANTPLLDSVQRRLVEQLTDCGHAHVSFAELFGNRRSFEELRERVGEWLSSERVIAEERAYRTGGYKKAHFKEFLVRWYGRESGGVLIPWDSPWLRLALDEKVLNIANYYFGMMTRLYHVDVWNTIALAHEGPLIGSQRWHRDPADVKLLKIFLYFSDVDPGCGALQYVPHSRTGERYGQLWPQDPPFDGARPPADEFERRIPPTAWVTCAHPTGTLVFADTSGFHRGGRAREHNRVLATWAYSSSSSRWPRTYRLEVRAEPNNLQPASRYALSLSPAKRR